MSAININHEEGSIKVDSGILQITSNGGVKIGNGNYLNEDFTINEDYNGVIRFNKNTGKLQYCDGHTWKDFSSNEQDLGNEIFWSIIF